MSRFGIILFLALACIAAHSAEPKKWYAPQDGWDGGNAGEATIYAVVGEESGEFTFEVDEHGNSPRLKAYISTIKNNTVKAAYQAIYEALQAQVMAKNTSDNLNALFAGGVAQITAADNTQSSGSYQFTPKEGNKVELSLTGVQTVKAGGGLEKSQGKIGISGWDSKDGISYSIADVLMGKYPNGSSNPFANYMILARTGKGGTTDYVPIGRLDITGGAPVDDKSVTTNTANGAVESGKISLYGFSNATGTESTHIPYVDKSGDTLDWAGLTHFIDGESLAYDSENDCLKIKGYSPSLGPNKYLGTGDEAHGGGWGVHNLPNVTTNSIDVDDVTIKAEVHDATGTKIISLASIPPSAGLPYAATATGNGGIAYIPLPEAVTNMESGCECSNAWDNIEAWLDHDMRESPMYGVPSYWVGGGLEAWAGSADGYSIRLWNWGGDNQTVPCQENLSTMLTDPEVNMQHAYQHEIVTRYTSSGGSPIIHYLPIGSVLEAAVAVDRVSIVTNGSKEVSLLGFEDAAAGQVATKGENGALMWRPPSGNAIRLIGTQGEAVVGSGSTTNTITFASAQDSNVSITVAPDGSGNATVTIGVYYVP